MTTVRPLGNRILAKRLDGESVSSGGLIIPETAKEIQSRGVVLAVGLGIDSPLDVQVGDTIVFGKYDGEEIEVDGETQILIDEDDVLAIEEAA